MLGLFKFSPNDTSGSNESHFALSAVPVTSPEVHQPRSYGHELQLNSLESRDGFSNNDAHTPTPYDFPMVAPPYGYGSDSGSTSIDELHFSASDPSTDVLGDITVLDSEFSDNFEQEMRDAILGPKEAYSRKVFVGSVPTGTSYADLEEFFSKFGPMVIDFRTAVSLDECGYAFIVFEDASSVNKLLDACVIGEHATHAILLPCKTVKNAGKFIVISAWRNSDSFWRNSMIKVLDGRYAVFVGGVPRVCSATSLAQVFESEFGNVGKVSIELEPLTGFPKGVAKVTFFNRNPYMVAINRKRVKLFSVKSVKEVEVKPYLESAMRCEYCLCTPTGIFCGGPHCNLYVCEECWPLHRTASSHPIHTAMCRNEGATQKNQTTHKVQQTPHRSSSRHAEERTGFLSLLPPSNSHLPNTHRTNTFEGIRDNSCINIDHDTTSSSRFGLNGGFRSVAQLIADTSNKRNDNMALFTSHNNLQLHHSSTSMLQSLPSRRTSIAYIIPQEQIDDYSLRVFIGGFPKGVTADDLIQFFTSFGQVNVDIDPNSEGKHAFLHFMTLSAVRALVTHCYLVDNRRMLPMYLESQHTQALVHVRPWLKHNRLWINGSLPINLDTISTRYSIFIGGIPNSTTANELAQVVQSHFGDVAVLILDVDSVFEYPRGSARAVFLTKDVYVRAIQKKYLTVFNRDQPRQIELKPFVDSDVPCENCGRGNIRSFCPDLSCLKYFCKICWEVCHIYKPDHRPLRTSRITAEERRAAAAKRRGGKIMCPPSPYAKDDCEPNAHEDVYDFLNGSGPSFKSNTLLSAFDQLHICVPPARKDFGPIGSGRPN